jgi:hypothetical protein
LLRIVQPYGRITFAESGPAHRKNDMADWPSAVEAVGSPLEANLELTVLMPCLNEAATLGTCIGKALSF